MQSRTQSAAPRGYLRHTLAVRVMHWVNVVALALLFMSGLQIFNAHPALYWGKSSYTGRPPLLEIAATTDAAGQRTGVLRVGSLSIDATGLLGAGIPVVEHRT